MPGFNSGEAAVFVRAPEPDAPRRERGPSGPVALQSDSSGLPRATESAYERDVRVLQATLKHAFEEERPDLLEKTPVKSAPGFDAVPAGRAQAGARRAWTGRLLKVGVGVALVVVFGWMPLKTLLVASSVEAVVNSRIVTIRSPIDGVVAAAPHDSGMWSAAKGAPVLRIVDDKADRARLDQLHSQLGNLEDERPSLAARLDLALTSLDESTQQTRQFAEGRIRQLNARIGALNHEFAAASARKT
jgi:hypothetical protein